MLWEIVAARYRKFYLHKLDLNRVVLEEYCLKFLRETLAGKTCGKFLQENLAGKSCRKRRGGKNQLKKGSDWWKFSIWNRVMGSPPIGIKLGKILRENLAGNSCGKFLREILVGNSCGKFLREFVVGNCCG